MLIVGQQMFVDEGVASAQIQLLDSRKPKEATTIQSVSMVHAEQAGYRAAPDYLVQLTFDNTTLATEQFARHLTNLHVRKEKLLFSIPLSHSRSFATLTPIDSFGVLWATPTFPIYPYNSLIQKNSSDFAYCVYVNRVRKTTGYTVDQLQGVVSFDPPLQPTDEVLMRYQHIFEGVVVQATFSDWAESPLFKTGEVVLQSVNDSIIEIPEFFQVYRCHEYSGLFLEGALTLIESDLVFNIEYPIPGDFYIRIVGDITPVFVNTLDLELTNEVMTISIDSLEDVLPSTSDFILDDEVMTINVIADDTPFIDNAKPTKIEIVYDGVVVFTHNLDESRIDDWREVTVPIPDSVTSAMPDPSLAQIRVRRKDLSNVHIDSMGLFTLKAVPELFEVMTINIDSTETILFVQEADIVLTGQFMEINIDSLEDLSQIVQGAEDHGPFDPEEVDPPPPP